MSPGGGGGLQVTSAHTCTQESVRLRITQPVDVSVDRDSAVGRLSGSACMPLRVSRNPCSLPSAVQLTQGASWLLSTPLQEKPASHAALLVSCSLHCRRLITAAPAPAPAGTACVACCRCDEVVCSSTEDVAARVKAITGGSGAAAVIDSVGGALSQSLSGAVRDGGSIWLYGLMEGLTFTGSGVDCLFRCVVQGCAESTMCTLRRPILGWGWQARLAWLPHMWAHDGMSGGSSLAGFVWWWSAPVASMLPADTQRGVSAVKLTCARSLTSPPDACGDALAAVRCHTCGTAGMWHIAASGLPRGCLPSRRLSGRRWCRRH